MTASLYVLALLYAFFNGLNDSPSLVAPVVSTRAMRPRQALLLTALAQATGPLLLGTAVARTIATGLVGPEGLPAKAVAAALVAALLWSAVTWYLALPSSSSHALVGGLVGGGLASMGVGAIKPLGLFKVGGALILSPLLGLLGGFLMVALVLRLARDARPSFNNVLRRWEVIGMLTLGVSHGASDAPKSMGILALGLYAAGATASPSVSPLILFPCIAAFVLGTSAGGWRQMRTLGIRIYHLRPIHGFGALAAGTGVVVGAALFGGPISTSQVMASAILGAGAAERLNQVRWLILRDMLMAWLLTLPATLLLAGGLYLLAAAA